MTSTPRWRSWIDSGCSLKVASHPIKPPPRGSVLFPIKAAVTAHEVDGGLDLHDSSSGNRYHLNSVAQVVWQLCDGTRQSGDIAAEVASLFGTSSAAVARDVDDVLARFAHAGLILSGGVTATETDLLLRTVRMAIGTEPPGSIGDTQHVDWNALVQLALEHGVMPLLYRALAAHRAGALPPIVLDRLRRQYRANARVTRFLMRELVELLAAFETHGIRAIPLRGPVLALSLYGRLTARQFGDLDVFVAPRDVDRASDLLVARGYRFGPRRATDAVATRIAPQGEVTVDLQWAVARNVFRFPIRLEELWDRLVPVSIAGVRVWQPAPDDHVLLLCAHASKHCWSSLIWIADLAAFVPRLNSTGFDWAALGDRAVRCGGARQLLLGLHLGHSLLRADIPPVLLPRMHADSTIPSLARKVSDRLFVSVQQRSHQGAFGVVEGALLYVRSRERVRDRIPYGAELLRHALHWLRALVTPNVHDLRFVDLPDRFRFLYYVVRPIRLATDIARRRRRAATFEEAPPR